MIDTAFSDLNLDPRLLKAVEEMGFTTATPVQAEAIPLIRTGADVIARSQTGTGKTVAFALPALEAIEADGDKNCVSVLILCPTRELAQQAGEEIRKLARFLPGIRPAEVYGGADMERQIFRLRRANLVVGTPGRVMDHLRRRTLKLEHLKMIVLDEADEMLKMGFREDIETILQDAPEERQTVLFSATMPPAILELTGQFQRDPALIEINKSQVTIENIDQSAAEVPALRKNDALALLLRYHRPTRAIVFCNTKRMVDELSLFLNERGFAAESLHGDIKQSQRTTVMNAFKAGRISILIATDVAARGIDVNDIDYVFNYDIPLTTEYYVHRIGRTGRAGKSGKAITLCCGKRQMSVMRGIAREVKSEIRTEVLPTVEDLKEQARVRDLDRMETALSTPPSANAAALLARLEEKEYSPAQVAAAALALCFPEEDVSKYVFPVQRRSADSVGELRGIIPAKKRRPGVYADILIDIGSNNRVAPNHLVGAITERSGLSGNEIGKIDIYPDQSVVGVPADKISDVLISMQGCKICGRPTRTVRMTESISPREDRRRPQSKAAHFAAERINRRKDDRGGDPMRHHFR